MPLASLLSMLRERAGLQPNDTAFTFTDYEQDGLERLGVVKNDVTSAISNSHGLNVADLVLVQPGSIPTTTSRKIQRSACVEHHRSEQFTRLDA
jgi:fatty acid CoA ligase FadD21